MTRRVFIIHGWDGSPNEILHQLLKEKFSNQGFEVYIPKMPNSTKPKINEWINKIKEIVKTPNENIYFIGHSIGCQGVLRYLETITNKVGKIILIAPWMHLDKNTIEEEGEEVWEIARPWMETPINWKKVKRHCNSFISIFSGDDPYVPLSNANLFKKNLNAQIIILKKIIIY